VALTLFTEAKAIKLFAWVITLSFGYLAFNLNQQYLSYPLFLVNRGFGGIDNNGAAMIMVLGVPPTLFMGMHVKQWWMKGVCFFSTLCLIHVVLFSFSRGAELGLIMVGTMTFVAILLALPRKGLTLMLGIFLIWFTITMAGPGVRHEFWSIFASEKNRDASAESRFSTWTAGWECMKDHPLGVGPRNFNLIATQYGLGKGKSIHNLYLQTGADYGFIGAFGLILFYFGSAWQSYSMSLSPTARRLGWPRHFGQMCAISLAGFSVCSIFIGMETVEHGFIVATLGLCTVAYVRNLAAQEEAHSQEPIPELVDVPPQGMDVLPQLA
jgi:O-antigen ligase